ncbi:hypothetical protein C8R45DRAFT_935559 [Mycena sanguinolenta]|nr:hypothetical protein C8R45DRAFT_935559 [Mycena sanguinolenta]
MRHASARTAKVRLIVAEASPESTMRWAVVQARRRSNKERVPQIRLARHNANGRQRRGGRRRARKWRMRGAWCRVCKTAQAGEEKPVRVPASRVVPEVRGNRIAKEEYDAPGISAEGSIVGQSPPDLRQESIARVPKMKWDGGRKRGQRRRGRTERGERGERERTRSQGPEHDGLRGGCKLTCRSRAVAERRRRRRDIEVGDSREWYDCEKDESLIVKQFSEQSKWDEKSGKTDGQSFAPSNQKAPAHPRSH